MYASAVTQLDEQIKFAFPDGEMERWLVLGAATAGNVRAWVRAPGETTVPVRLVVDGQPAVSGSATIYPDADHTGTIDLAVPPEFANRQATVEAAGFTRALHLAPAEDAREPFAFWFGSCNQPFDSDSDYRMSDSPRSGIYRVAKRAAEAKGVRFGILAGDQMYADEMPFIDIREWAAQHPDVSDAALLDSYRQLYRGYFNQPGIRGLQEAFPSFLIWDDHEIFNSWGSALEVSDLDERVRRAAFQAYKEYQHSRNPGGSILDVPPFHYSFWYASVGFFVFDLRGERDYREERVIGELQWKAFDAFLAEAEARNVETVFIVTSIPVVHFSPAIVRLLDRLPGHDGDNARDRWDAGANCEARDRILEAIFDWQAARPTRNVLVLSGDVHAGAAFTVSRKGPRSGQFAQWTASALSSPGGVAHDFANRLATLPVNFGKSDRTAKRHGIEPDNNVGIVELAPRERGPGHSVSLSIYGYDPKRRRLRRSIHHVLA